MNVTEGVCPKQNRHWPVAASPEAVGISHSESYHNRSQPWCFMNEQLFAC